MIAQLIAPVNGIKGYAHEHPDSIAAYTLHDKAGKLFDLLKYRVENNNEIGHIIEDLKEDAFELRIALLHFASSDEDYAKVLQKAIAEEIADKTVVKLENKALSQTYREVLELYSKIAMPVIALSTGTTNLKSQVDYSTLNYNVYKAAFAQFPPVLADKLIQLLDSSLNYELSLAIIALSLDKQIKLKEKVGKQLITIAKDSIENFGFYSALLGTWQPDENDESQIVRNIKIRLAIEELTTKRSPVSLKEVGSLFTV